jgi:hypothetical protein
MSDLSLINAVHVDSRFPITRLELTKRREFCCPAHSFWE